MAHRKRTGTLAAIVLATTLGIAPPAEAGVIDWARNKAKDVMTYVLGCDPCPIESDKKPEPTPAEPDKKREEGRSTSTSTRRAPPTPRSTPAPNLNKFYYDVGMAQEWCAPGTEPNRDYAQIFSSKTGPRQTAAGYHTRFVQRPDTDPRVWEIVRDGTIWGHEIRQEYFKQPDGTYRVDLVLDEHLVDRSGKVRAERGVAFEPIVTSDCYKAPEPVCCDEKIPENVVPQIPVSQDTPRERTSEATKEWTIGMGVLSDTTESAFWTTGRNPQLVPYEDIFRGTKMHAKFEYTTNNDLFAVYGAMAQGTDNPTDGFWADCERYVEGTSLGAHAEIGLFNTAVTPYIVGGAEWKRVETGTSAGRFGSVVDMNYDTLPVHAGIGLLVGKQNGDNLKIAGEYVWQNMNIQNFGMSPNNEDRGDGVAEDMLMVTAAGQKFLANDHGRVYADLKHMWPQAQRATNPDEVIQESVASNGRIGFDYYFTPQSSGSWKIGLEGQVAVEDAKFPDGINMNRTSTSGLINIGYRWK